MTERNIAAVVLGAGMGTRMKSSLPKVLHAIGGRAMISHILDTVDGLGASRAVVVVGPGMDNVAAEVAPHDTVLQDPQLGTGHAVMQARDALAGFDGDVLVLYGDTPLITSNTLAAMLDARAGADDPAVVVLGFRPDDPAEYGRLVTNDQGALDAIVEYREADAATRAINLCNSGVLAVDGKVLFSLLDRVTNDNAKGEYYLTDLVALARGDGRTCAVVEAAPDELLGVNNRIDLAAAEAVLQRRLRAAAMAGGVTMQDPNTVWLSHDTVFGQDVSIGPNVFFGPGAVIGDNVDIRPFCHIEQARVGDGAQIGPFARLRPKADIGETARIGNFVEVKAATVEAGAKVNHLTYIGDARVGAGANVGAGTITCNYDGISKSRTDIGAGAFIGSNTALVAPVTVGDGAMIGAGSVVSDDVPADALAVTRAPQKSIPGGAGRYKTKRRAAKAAE